MPTIAIADQLKALLELQKLDGEIYRLRRQLRAKPAEVARLKEAQQTLLQSLQAAESRYKTLEVKRNQKETDLGQREEQLRKLQTQLFQVKTNKEYSAMQKEIEGAKADQSVLEEELLRMMEEVDQAKTQVQTQRQGLKQEEEKLTAQMKALEEKGQRLEELIQELQGQRGGLTPRVEASILAQYERILERKEGMALAPVRGNACGGCFMGLTPQAINEVQLNRRLIPCESCARILYMEPAV